MSIVEIIASILLILAAFMVVATAISLWRAPDALTRVNLLGPTVGIALPMSLVALFIVDSVAHGFSWIHFIQVVLTLFGVWIVASVGSFYMGRSIYGVSVTDLGAEGRAGSDFTDDRV